MKKALLIISLITVVMLVGVPQASAVEPTDSISVFAAVEETGVSVTPEGPWEIGVVALLAERSSVMYTATNLGTVQEDFAIEAADIGAWACGADVTVGDDIFEMGFDDDDTPLTLTSICDSVPLATGIDPGNTYVDPVEDPGTAPFYLHFQAPSGVTMAAPGAIIVTVTATQTP